MDELRGVVVAEAFFAVLIRAIFMVQTPWNLARTVG